MLRKDGNELLKKYTERTFKKEILRLSERVYYFMGYGHSNATLIIGETQCILIDALDTNLRAKRMRAEIEKISQKPVKTIIYTHSHPDHRGGAGAFKDTAEEIIAFSPARPLYKYNEIIAPYLGMRGEFQFGYKISDEELMIQGIGIREGVAMHDGEYDFLAPTTLYNGDKIVKRIIDGVEIHLVSAVGETDDQIFVWLPQEKVLCCGDNFYPCWPNLSPIRGGQYRDISAWIDSLDLIRSYSAEVLLPGHAYAILGREEIEKTLKNYRDALEFVLLETLKAISSGKTVDEIIMTMKLPAHLEKLDYLGDHYGTLAWSIKGIYNGYIGWFDGNPINLNPLSEKDKASRIVDNMGGKDKVIDNIIVAIDNKEFQWAMTLCDFILSDKQHGNDVNLLKAKCCRALAEQETNANGRHYYYAYAQYLENSFLNLVDDQ